MFLKHSLRDEHDKIILFSSKLILRTEHQAVKKLVRSSIYVCVSSAAPEFGALTAMDVGWFFVIVIDDGLEGDGEDKGRP